MILIYAILTFIGSVHASDYCLRFANELYPGVGNDIEITLNDKVNLNNVDNIDDKKCVFRQLLKASEFSFSVHSRVFKKDKINYNDREDFVKSLLSYKTTLITKDDSVMYLCFDVMAGMNPIGYIDKMDFKILKGRNSSFKIYGSMFLWNEFVGESGYLYLSTGIEVITSRDVTLDLDTEENKLVIRESERNNIADGQVKFFTDVSMLYMMTKYLYLHFNISRNEVNRSYSSSPSIGIIYRKGHMEVKAIYPSVMGVFYSERNFKCGIFLSLKDFIIEEYSYISKEKILNQYIYSKNATSTRSIQSVFKIFGNNLSLLCTLGASISSFIYVDPDGYKKESFIATLPASVFMNIAINYIE